PLLRDRRGHGAGASVLAMTRLRRTARWMGLLGAALAAAPQLAHARTTDLFYERTVLSAADGRCGLFTPDVAMALAAGAAPGRGLPLARRLPPPLALKAYAASARSPAGEDLLPKTKGGWAFRFPEEAVNALASLDPREAVVVELLMPGDGTRRAYVEVG